MSREEIIEDILSNVTFKHITSNSTGGQLAGLPITPIYAESLDLDLKITVAFFRSMRDNKEFAMSLMRKAAEELVLKDSL